LVLVLVGLSRVTSPLFSLVNPLYFTAAPWCTVSPPGTEQHRALLEREVGKTTLLEHLAVMAEVPQNEAAHESEDLGGKR
jgi:hypothetical protein